MRILVACAVAEELGDFALPDNAEVVVTGIGPIESAIAVSCALIQHRYDLLLNVGIGGGFAPHAEVGARVVVTSEQYVELGREDHSQIQLPDDVKLIDQTHPSQVLLQRYRTAYVSAGRSAAPILFGAGVTSATITTSDQRAALLQRQVPDAMVESMEGFALLRTAEILGVPALELRGISNRVGDRARSGWNLRAGVEAATSLLRETLVVFAAL